MNLKEVYYMKKVRKQDIEELITLYYKEFIELLTDEEFETSIHVNINSIFIYIIDYRDFDDEELKKKLMDKFAEEIKKITFGNLEVTYRGAKKDGNLCISWMYISNAYELEIKDNDDEYDDVAE